MRKIAFVSGKGGVGKTTISLNVSVCLANVFRKNVVLFDMNDDSVNLWTIFGKSREKKFGVEYIRGDKEALESISEKDFMIIDMPPGIEKVLEKHSDDFEYFIVVNPDILSLSDSYILTRKLENLGAKISGIIINRVERRKSELSKEKIRKMLKYDIVAEIPEDKALKDAMSNGIPILFYKKSSKAWKKIVEFCSNLLGIKQRKGIFARIFGL